MKNVRIGGAEFSASMRAFWVRQITHLYGTDCWAIGGSVRSAVANVS